MKILRYIIPGAALASLAWLAWQSPLPASAPASVKVSLPAPVQPASAQDGKRSSSLRHQQPIKSQAQPLWRVVTRRVISKEGIASLKKRLLDMHLQPISIQSTETMTMHAFDDAVLFKSRRQAQTIARFWQQHEIETTVIKAFKGAYLVGLGRLYQAKYAEEMQKQLDRVGRKYRYQQRIVPIPVRRFTFAPGDRQSSEALWKKLEATGVMTPVMMSETQFAKTYGDMSEPK